MLTTRRLAILGQDGFGSDTPGFKSCLAMALTSSRPGVSKGHESGRFTTQQCQRLLLSLLLLFLFSQGIHFAAALKTPRIKRATPPIKVEKNPVT